MAKAFSSTCFFFLSAIYVDYARVLRSMPSSSIFSVFYAPLNKMLWRIYIFPLLRAGSKPYHIASIFQAWISEWKRAKQTRDTGATVKIAIRYNKRTYLIIFLLWLLCWAEAHWIQFTLVHYMKGKKREQKHWNHRRADMLPFFHFDLFFFSFVEWEKKTVYFLIIRYSVWVFLLSLYTPYRGAQSRYIDFGNNFVLPSICLCFYVHPFGILTAS